MVCNGEKKNGIEESKRVLLGNDSELSADSQVLGCFLVGLGSGLDCHPLKDTSESKNRGKINLLLDPFLYTVHSRSGFHMVQEDIVH